MRSTITPPSSLRSVKCYAQSLLFVLANPKCIITADVAVIGKKKYLLKSNIDKALSGIIQKESMKSRVGSKSGSVKSLNLIPEKSEKQDKVSFQRSLSYDTSESDLEVKEKIPEEKTKLQYVVLMATRSEVQDSADVPWNDDCDFKLEEVKILNMHNIISFTTKT